jgi:tungstate transport system substrate-binding protein
MCLRVSLGLAALIGAQAVWADVALARSTIRLATTTSTMASGLLDAILPAFEREWGARVDVIAVGTGKALRLAQHGDVDAVLVHAPADEKMFVEEGHGVNRRRVMANDFVIVGPPADPAAVSRAPDAAEAFSRIAWGEYPFVSRGDRSGTHIKERAVWRSAKVDPEGEWYLEAGQGMGGVLQMADQLMAYTLADRGTVLAYRGKMRLVALFEDDPALDNPYSIIATHPARWPGVNYMGAMLLIGWLTSPDGQERIGQFRKGDEVLFRPTALPEP